MRAFEIRATLVDVIPKRTGKRLDVVQNAKRVFDEAIRRAEEIPVPAVNPATVSEVMRAMGRKGGKIGGRKRMDAMTPEARSALGKAAIQARWDKYWAEKQA